MKQLRIGRRRAELVDAPDPVPHEDWVVIKIQAAPLCTEYKTFIGDRMEPPGGVRASFYVFREAGFGSIAETKKEALTPWPARVACNRCSQQPDSRRVQVTGGTQSDGPLAVLATA